MARLPKSKQNNTRQSKQERDQANNRASKPKCRAIFDNMSFGSFQKAFAAAVSIKPAGGDD
jgi:hypothetical protein